MTMIAETVAVYQKKKKPKKSETCLGIALLVVLAVIAALIFFKQYQYNPAVVALRAPLIFSQKVASKADPGLATPEGMTPLTPVEVFKAQNLSDKINGKADLYLSAGFRGLQSQRFKINSDPDSWLEIFAFDMGSVLNAFAVFSQQRREDSRPADIALYSYETQNSLFFIHGPYYVEIIASAASENILRAVHSLARRFVDDTQVAAGSIKALKLFPQLHLVKNSIAFTPVNAFGYEGLDQVFTAVYKMGSLNLTAFISQRKTPAEAEKKVLAYRDFLKTYGGKSLPLEIKLENIQGIQIFDTVELVFSIGPYLAGVHESPDRQKAEALAVLLNEKLSEAPR